MNRQNILLIILVLSLAAGAYVWYSYLYVAPEAPVVGQASAVSPEFLAKAGLLDRIKIDSEFLKSGIFSELVSGPILPPTSENINGRANPFAQF